MALRWCWCGIVVAMAACGKGSEAPSAAASPSSGSAVVKSPAASGGSSAAPSADVALRPDEGPVDGAPTGADCADQAACTTACTAKLSAACARLGALRDPPSSIEDRCTLGDGGACWRRASQLKRDPAQGKAAADVALRTDDASCQAGDGRACLRLATMLTVGDNVPPDPKRVADAEARACTLGLPGGCLQQAKNEPARAAELKLRALRIELTACDQGNNLACMALWEDPPVRDRAAHVTAHMRATLDKSCAGGAAGSCRTAIVLGADQQDDADIARDLTAWGAACADGAGDACVSYAWVLSPDDTHDVGEIGLDHLEKLRDAARGKDAWAKACAYALHHMDDPGAEIVEVGGAGRGRACKRAAALGVDTHAFAPPIKPPVAHKHGG
jgi:hypothetical protein